MNYAEKNLTKGEEIILVAKRNYSIIIPKILKCIITFIITALIIKGLDELIKLLTELGTEYLDGQMENIITKEFIEEIIQYVDYVYYAIWAIWALASIIPIIKQIGNLCSTCLCITNKRVIGKRGIFRIHTLDYPIEKVDNVTLKSSFWGNLLHFQTIVILGGGNATAASSVFYGISNGTAFKNTVTEAIEQHAEDARRAQAEEIARAMAR